jgi:hypothetical protein
MWRWVRIAVIAATVSLSFSVNAAQRKYTGDEDLTVAWERYARHSAAAEPGMKFPFSNCFRRAAVVNKVPETLLLAVARGESDFDPTARSHANAHGVMQILWPTTARHLGLNLLSDLYDPCKNIDAGARYLKELIDAYNGDLHLALAAYNYGPGRIPKNAAIPQGAEWYSGYIYHHMKFILSRSRAGKDELEDYADSGKLVLISFSEPYRAAAFVESLERASGGLHIDWFRSGQAEYRVVMPYGSKQELMQKRSKLAQAGFNMP